MNLVLTTMSNEHKLAKQRKEERQRVGTALAKILGPVHELYNEGPINPVMRLNDKSDLYHYPPLKPHVKALPEGAMEALLTSDELMCQTENDVYTLLCFWITQSMPDTPWEAKLPVYACLAHRIRYHHLSSYFLSEFVARCHFANDSGVLSSIMKRVLFYRDNDKAAEKDRARGTQEYTFRTKISLQDILKLQTSSGSCKKYVGVEDLSARIDHCRRVYLRIDAHQSKRHFQRMAAAPSWVQVHLASRICETFLGEHFL